MSQHILISTRSKVLSVSRTLKSLKRAAIPNSVDLVNRYACNQQLSSRHYHSQPNSLSVLSLVNQHCSSKNIRNKRQFGNTIRLNHPLLSLTAKEIEAAAIAVRQHVGVLEEDDLNLSKLRFVAISLKEPLKSELIEYAKSTTIPSREAEVVAINPTTGLASEYIVKLDDISSPIVVNDVTLPPGVQPMFTPDDCDLAESIVQNSVEVAAILKERYGIDDMKRVACDPWSIHLACPDDAALTNWNIIGKPGRLVQTFLYYRSNGNDMDCNHYAHPIDITPIVDLNEQAVVTIHGLDRKPVKIPDLKVNYHRNLVKENSYLEKDWRFDTLKQLNVVQPDGPSFQVSDDNVVTWQKWSIRVGFNYREGIVLHDVMFDGRPIVNRASLVEMAVPYADINPPFQRKCAFDVGDYGLGYCANSLELGCDCLGHIHYFDAVLCNSSGKPVEKKKVICMHEEDDGILWKHVDYRNGHNESRRSRELIISSIATVVNYEYLFYWKFKQDGMIEFEIKLTGELSTNNLSESEEVDGQPKYGVIVAPGVNAQIHQHMFCARLDMNVDGNNRNTVSEMDIVPQIFDPKTNPYGNAFNIVETKLDEEQSAIRTADATKARYWKISNSSGKINPINQKPTAYKLIPFTKGPAHPVLLLDEKSVVSMKGKFATANLWVTKHNESERYPAGEYTPQADGINHANGLTQWIQKNRNIKNDDIVLWHAFGVTHIPRIEDFPVMPCESTGFTLKPDNFFNGNPTIDLPPDKNEASRLAKGCCPTK